MKTSQKPEQSWARDFNCNNIEWEKNNIILPIKCTIDTKLREFQYKFLKRIIPTNIFLFKCKLAIISNVCDVCSSDIETVKHLFWDFQVTQTFWLQLKNLFRKCQYEYFIEL